MKHVTLLSLVAASLLFTACGEKTKEAASDAASKVTEAVKADTTTALEVTKKAAAEAAESAKKAAEAAATAAKAAAEEKSVAAAQALKERAAATTASVRETADSAVNSVKDATSSAVESVKKVVADNTAGKAAYAKCAGCHGADGKTKALGKSEIIAGQSAGDLETKLAEYKAGTRNVAGMGMLMKGQVASIDEATIKAVAAYISSL